MKLTELVWAQVQHTAKDNAAFKTAVFERLMHEDHKYRKMELHQILLGNRNCNEESGWHTRETSATNLLLNQLNTTMMMIAVMKIISQQTPH